MQARTIAKLAIAKLAVLGVGLAVYRYVDARRRAGRGRAATNVDTLDANDPTDDLDYQDFDIGLISVGPTDADVLAGLDEAGGFHIEDDLDSRAVLRDSRIDTTFDAAHDLGPARPHDSGDLYGVVTQTAVDTELSAGEADGFVHADEGETWLEALSASATEFGALPERMIEVGDERVRTANPRQSRDVPVADFGAGGPEGL